MRGEGKDGRYFDQYRRITPAYAGRRPQPISKRKPKPDHPRVCGEKIGEEEQKVAFAGSPPRMRGEGIQARYKRVRVRITPAYAGRSPACGQGWASP